MLSLLDSAILGAVQGLTEFLPISSSGHLLLARELLGINTTSGLAFDAVLQLGTVLAVVIVFWKDLTLLARAAWMMVTGQGARVSAQDRTLTTALVVGTIPAILLGLLLEDAMETIFRSALLVACTLIGGSLLMFFAESRARQLHALPSTQRGFLIGLFQTLALIPGVSRSGVTISGGLLLGLTREAATRFSFLLSLPIIAGSGAVKLLKIIGNPPTDFSYTALAVGFVVSFGVGYLAIRWLITYLKQHPLNVFAWYRIALALTVLAILFIRTTK